MPETRLLVIRHAIAEDKESFAVSGQPDTERPTTKKGRKRMKLGASGIRQLVPVIDLLASSPWRRAMETAGIVASRYSDLNMVEAECLAGDASQSDLIEWLKLNAGTGCTAIVGHEPNLSELAARLLCGKRSAFLRVKKGGALLIAFEAAPLPGKGTLLWSLEPAHLRTLGKVASPG
jgi:phosphohistidine phosphatase